MRKFNKGLDEQMLEGGRGAGGGGGYRSPSKLETAAKVGGPAALAFIGGAGGSEMIKNAREKREAEVLEAANMKRAAREKTSDERAREAAAEESMQRKVNKAAEDASKDMGFKKGGMTASKRADGIAQRGKTRGTIIMCGGGMTRK
jgi:hypothetical protein